MPVAAAAYSLLFISPHAEIVTSEDQWMRQAHATCDFLEMAGQHACRAANYCIIRALHLARRDHHVKRRLLTGSPPPPQL
jgi:hypothetical protein